jgi:hypothetical protein
VFAIARSIQKAKMRGASAWRMTFQPFCHPLEPTVALSKADCNGGPVAIQVAQKEVPWIMEMTAPKFSSCLPSGESHRLVKRRRKLKILTFLAGRLLGNIVKCAG